ncbi:unnamed protein product [Darwinula stevensoni]|uniref:CD80-like immunoglobulin C2-set domain-containing protein n=1 Tax=Darwinula stevensoni TaxID=69355 RepID=A0A7R9ADN7_9CRUS|nr:unnamed protein product [Darwinula stevensoni]CAG0900928.1 unnamed protein product [Darwinula stevensoni]
MPKPTRFVPREIRTGADDRAHRSRSTMINVKLLQNARRNVIGSVTEFPEEGPRITGIKPYYHWGDLVRVNCTTRRSKPVASLAWYINGKQAERELVQEFFPFTDQTGLETAVLGLSFRLASPDRLSDDVIQAYPRIVLKCTASIANVYWEQAEADVKIRAESRASLPSSRAQDASSVAEGEIGEDLRRVEDLRRTGGRGEIGRNGKGSPGHSLSPVFVSLLLFDFYFRC